VAQFLNLSGFKNLTGLSKFGVTRSYAMKNYHFLLLTFSFLLSPFSLSSQDFGSFPPGIKWYQLKTKGLRVIYPEGLDQQAQRVSGLIRYEDANNRTSIGPRRKHLDLILNNQGVISNGYVATMPFKSEFYTTPPQDNNSLGSNDWLDLLSIHEYRHVLQYTNLRRGLSKIGYILMGEPGWSLFMMLAVPDWFFEGDAVVTETALTTQGRGRIPYFMSQYRSIELDSVRYRYMKARNGSYKDYVPDHYTLGYLLCSYGRETYGNDFWTKVLNRTVWYRGLMYPFADAVLLYTGSMTRGFYREAMNQYRDKWYQEENQLKLTPGSAVSKDTKTVTAYRHPVYLPDGELLVHKESYKQTGAIYKIAMDGTEEMICETGIAQDLYFTAGGPWLAWAEVSWDSRFSARNYSDIVLFNRETGVKRYLTSHQRYFSPALSSDGTKVLVVENDLMDRCNLLILDINSGKVLQSLPNPDQYFFTCPKWDTDGNHIVSAVRTGKGNMKIIRQEVASGTIHSLTPSENHIIGELWPTRDKLYYSSSYSGVNNVYSLDKASSEISRLTSTRFGAYHPAVSPDEGSLVYSEFTRKGLRLMTASLNELTPEPFRPLPLDQLESFNRSFFKEEGGNILSKVPDDTVHPKRYYNLLHPVRIHSWAVDPTDEAVVLTVVSDNTLGNLHFEAGGSYYWNEKVPGFSASAYYGGTYPILSLSLARNYRKTNTGGQTVLSTDDIAGFSANLPLNYSKGLFFRQAHIGLQYNLIRNSQVTPDPGEGNRAGQMVHAAGLSMQYIQTKRQALQNITTPLGFGIEAGFDRALGELKGQQIYAIADGAIRGLWPNHNLVVSAGAKIEKASNPYQFLDLFIYPRGYTLPTTNWMTTLQTAYHLPLVYPDFGMLGIFYLMRVRGTVFADLGAGSVVLDDATTRRGLFASAGIELTMDTRWLNLLGIPLGCRFSYRATPELSGSDSHFFFEFVMTSIRL